MMRIITTETINATFIREFTRDIFTFAYLSGGISLVDMANLTSYNVHRGRLRYHRQKTHGAINFKLCEQAKEIIKKYAPYQKEAGYLFPIYDNRVHKTSVQKKNRLHKMLAKITYSGAYPFTFRQPIKHKIAFKSTILYPFIP